MEVNYRKLEGRMKKFGKADVCLAFSGGVDSSLLLHLAAENAAAGTTIYAVTFDTKLHAACDLKIARRVIAEVQEKFPDVKLVHEVIFVDELEQEEIRENPVNRCYLCKKQLFTKMVEFAKDRNVSVLIEGTNEDDLHVYRPGLQAIRELGIYSPLAETGITKEEVKALAAKFGISVAGRPSTPCMATRLPYGTAISYELLSRIADAEEWMRSEIEGNVRVRVHGETVRLEVDKQQFPLVLAKADKIAGALHSFGFRYITLDMEGFRSGSMDK